VTVEAIGKSTSPDPASLREMARWVAGFAGVVAVVAVAGVLLTGLPQSAPATLVAAFGFLMVFGAAIWVVTEAVPVLGSEVNSFRDLFELRKAVAREPALKLHRVQVKPSIDWVEQEMPGLTSRMADSLADLWKQKREVDYRRNQRPGPDDPDDIEDRYEGWLPDDLAAVEGRLDRVSDIVVSAAASKLVKAQHGRLMRAVVIAGAIAAIGATVFALAAVFAGDTKPTAVAAPTSVVVFLTGPLDGDAVAELGSGDCWMQREGVAIGGTWDRPAVVVASWNDCPQAQIAAGDDRFIVIPITR
jgi:hypothetical protein